MRCLLSTLRRSDTRFVTFSKPFIRLHSRQICPPTRSFGIAFDIDGVLLRGNTPIGGAPRALRRLFGSDGSLRIPFLFLTNGGGVPESKRAFELSRLLNIDVSHLQVVQGHSPFRTFVKRFENELVVTVGKGEPTAVMLEYGFKKVISIDKYSSYFNGIDPLSQYKNWEIKKIDSNANFEYMPAACDVLSERVKGIFVVSDPIDWGRDVQIQTKRRSNLDPERLSKLVFIKYNKALYERFQKRRLQNKNEDYDPIALDDLNYSSEWMTGRMGACNEFVYKEGRLTWTEVLCDILMTGGLPGSEEGYQPPLYFANDDLEYQSTFPSERLGMGAFRLALECIFNRKHKNKLEYTAFGKPDPLVFKNAEDILKKLKSNIVRDNQVVAGGEEVQSFSRLYMIGDNPSVDIQGAKKAGHPWFSILTRTGVFKGKDNHLHFPADLVVDTVEEAIEFILKEEST